MKRIFEGDVYDLVQKPDGFIFSHRADIIDDKMLMLYKTVDAQSDLIRNVSKNVYLLAKFGGDYKTVIKLISNTITAKAISLPSGKLFICDRDAGGKCLLLDETGGVLWNGTIQYRDCAPSDISLYNNCVWASFLEYNVLIRFNLATMREELRIGGARSPFSKPRGVFTSGNIATVSNIGSNTLTRVNLDTYTVEDYCRFDRSVKAYINVSDCEYVQLDDGIYRL